MKNFKEVEIKKSRNLINAALNKGRIGGITFMENGSVKNIRCIRKSLNENNIVVFDMDNRNDVDISIDNVISVKGNGVKLRLKK